MKYILLYLMILNPVMAKEDICNLSDTVSGYHQLKCLNNNTIASEIRRNFIDVKKRTVECKYRTDCIEVFWDTTKDLGIFKEKFMIIAFEKNDFGGRFVYLLFQKSKTVYRAWVYSVDKAVYQIRELKKIRPSDAFKKEIPSLISDPALLLLWR